MFGRAHRVWFPPIAATLLAGVALVLPMKAEVLVEGIAAQVGTDIVLASEVLQAAAEPTALARREGATSGDISRIRAEILDRMIERALIQQVVERAELQASEAEIDEAIAGIAAENDLSYQDMRAAVESQGMPWSFYRNRIRSEIENRKVMNGMVATKVRVTDEEVRELYEERLGTQPQSGEEFFLRHILITVSPERPALVACSLARTARGRVVGGEPFEEVASEVSEANPEYGGSTGWIHQREMAGWMSDTVMDMDDGQISGVVETPFGCNVLQVVDRRSYEPVSFEDARETLYDRVFAEKMQVEYAKFIEQLRSNTYIERKGLFADEVTPLPPIAAEGEESF